MSAFWLSPVEFNVVIEPDVTEAKTAGGVWLPDDSKENQGAAMMMGTLLAISPLAFNYDTWPDGDEDKRPKAGDRVLFAKFAGTVVKKPGEERVVRVCKDKDVIAVIHEGGSND